MTMTTERILPLVLAAVASIAYLGTAASLTQREEPQEAAYSHYLRFKVLAVTPVEKTATQELVQVTVQPWYGKVDRHSLELHKRYDTQELSFLFPAAPGAAINAGDILDYRIARYITQAP